MKCVKNLSTQEIKRVSDERAADLVANKGWSFTSKKEWKTSVRDVVVIPVKIEAPAAELGTETPVEPVKKQKVQGRQFAKRTGEN